jgi:hypothetical protein
MPAIIRLVMVIFGYLLACVAASLILTVGMLTPDWSELLAAGVQTAAFAPVVAIGAAIIAGIAMFPSLLVIVLAEGFAWRSSLVYGALGGALSLSLSYGLDFAGYAGEADGYATRDRQVLAAAGIAGGFVYWLFAGRKAGSWK